VIAKRLEKSSPRVTEAHDPEQQLIVASRTARRNESGDRDATKPTIIWPTGKAVTQQQANDPNYAADKTDR